MLSNFIKKNAKKEYISATLEQLLSLDSKLKNYY